jgi:hypothetical protein
MIKAEIASEMMRSRIQTPKLALTRGRAACGPEPLANDDPGTLPREDELICGFGSCMPASILYRAQRKCLGLYFEVGSNSALSGASRSPMGICRRLYPRSIPREQLGRLHRFWLWLDRGARDTKRRALDQEEVRGGFCET